MKFFQKAFTLAEIITVLAILGTVAAITIPSTANRVTQRANRTKIKKAMAVYDTALSKWYINGENSNYSEDLRTANVLDPNNELSEYQTNSAEYMARRTELIKERTARRKSVQSNYTEKFSNYFNTIHKDADKPNIFQTKDGLWWDIGTNGNFLSVIVAFKQEDLNATTANSNENKAFYMIAQMPEYAKTPVTNPTFGKDFETMTLWELENNSSSEITDITKMQKLYSYVNSKPFNYLGADKICKSSSCCNNTTGTCINIDPAGIGTGQWRTSRPEIAHEARKYNDGKITEYIAYDSDLGELVHIKYGKDNTESGTMKITRHGETPKCYTFTGIKDQSCSAITQVYWDLYTDKQYGSWTDLALNCRAVKTNCDGI